MKSYNGHRSYNAWNISLWISNDEGLYHFALECKNRPLKDGRKPLLSIAAKRFMQDFRGIKTPDGIPYTYTNVKLALSGLE